MLVVISDFYEEPDAVLEALGPLRFRGNDLIVFHVLDPRRARVRLRHDASAFEDLESGEQIPIVPQALREEYRKMIRAHIDAIAERCKGARIDYTMVDTSAPLDHALFRYLSMRETADEGTLIMSFLTPLFLARPRRARDPGDHSPDPEGAEERRRVPVADVPAADPVPVGAPAADPQLAAAAAAAGGAGADRDGVRAAVPAQRGARRGGGRAARARW